MFAVVAPVAVEHTVLVTQYTSVYPHEPSGRVELTPQCPVPDPLDLVAFLAAQTTTLGLAIGVLVLPNHHPVVLAERAATIDTLSSGRLRELWADNPDGARRAGRLAEVGARRLVLAMPAVPDIDEAKDTLSACAQRLGSQP